MDRIIWDAVVATYIVTLIGNRPPDTQYVLERLGDGMGDGIELGAYPDSDSAYWAAFDRVVCDQILAVSTSV